MVQKYYYLMDVNLYYYPVYRCFRCHLNYYFLSVVDEVLEFPSQLTVLFLVCFPFNNTDSWIKIFFQMTREIRNNSVWIFQRSTISKIGRKK